MSTFTYIAKDKIGKRTNGKLEAESLAAAKERLASDYPIVYRLKEQPKDYEAKALSLLAPVDVDDIVGISQSIASMSEGGMSLKRIFDMLYEDAENASLKRVLAAVSDELGAGVSLSVALERHSDIFPSYYIAMVAAGERSGNLPEMMRRLAKVITSVESLKGRTKAALSYPITLLIFTFIMFLVFFTYGSAYLDHIYQSLQIAQPMSTRLMLSLGITLSKSKFITLLLLLAILYLGYSLFNNPKVSFFSDKIRLSLPFLGQVYRTLYAARFLRTLSILYRSGLGTANSIKLSAATIDNEVVMEDLYDLSLKVEQGDKLSAVLRQSNYIGNLTVGMIAAGEECGKLEVMLTQVADVYELKSEAILQDIRSRLEPALMLFIGLAVALILAIIGWPMLAMVGS